jgi:hypothetical protein
MVCAVGCDFSFCDIVLCSVISVILLQFPIKREVVTSTDILSVSRQMQLIKVPTRVILVAQ